ncbi:MAG: hypothetical protein HQL32_11835 [Planctomycetes bacterium]|nr:hypothetical protein [Planctomycetota bacterium]
MKLVLLTQDAPLYLGQFLNDLLQELKTLPIEVEGVVVLSPIFKKSTFAELKARYKLYGLRDFALMLGHIIKEKICAKTKTLFALKPFYSVANALAAHKTRELRFKDVNSAEFKNFLRDEQVDIMLSIACPKIISAETLAIPKVACLNYHTGKLPKYRGRQPLYWALLNGEKEVGISIHEMAADIDDGPILVQETINIDSLMSLHQLYLRTLGVGPSLIAQAIKMVLENNPQRIENKTESSSYNSFPTQDDGLKFRERGLRYY